MIPRGSQDAWTAQSMIGVYKKGKSIQADETTLVGQRESRSMSLVQLFVDRNPE